MVSLALGPLLALSATLAPPEHLHESDSDHPQSLVHRHFESHEAAPHDHDGAEFDHAESRVVWLPDVAAYHAPYQLPLPDAALTARFELAQASERWVAREVDAGAPPHGPPRLARSLRGPPPSAL